MSANSSCVKTLHLLGNSSFSPLDCLTFRTSMLILTTFSIANILLILPLAALILYLGYQRRHISTAATSHSDIFTYHMVAMEIIAILACLLYCVGVNTNLQKMTTFSFDMFFCVWSSKLFFHALTCVEHYLAVVRPVTYRGLKKAGGVRIRNITIGCVWLSGFVRPGPGKVGGDRERVDQMKRSAFNTVVTIMGVLMSCLGGMLACNVLQNSKVLSQWDGGAVVASTVWWSLPSSFVLPLLYLNRAGKLPGYKQSVN
ncbi:hypothetical protein Q8A73_012629 [Channa argus]|nr:hypothetical protein Q8A73_012629 [Channa argus]